MEIPECPPERRGVGESTAIPDAFYSSKYFLAESKFGRNNNPGGGRGGRGGAAFIFIHDGKIRNAQITSDLL